MAKENTPSTLTPFRFVAGTDVAFEDYEELPRQAAYAAGYTPDHLAGAISGPLGWEDSAGGTAAEGHAITYTPGGAWFEYYDFRFRIGEDIQELVFAAVSTFAGGEDGEARLLIGGVPVVTLVFDNSTNDTIVADVLTAASIGGAGEYSATVEIRMTTGSATDNSFNRWDLYSSPVTNPAAWPDPST